MFKPNQPKLKLEKSSFELNLDIISGFIVLFQFFIILRYWNKLPDIIPSHFDSSGEANKWSGKISILFLPLTSLILFIGMTYLAEFPHIFSYLWKITVQNAEKQYRLAKNFVAFLKTFVLLVFALLTGMIIEAAQGRYLKQLNYFIFIFPVIIFSSMAYYIFKSYKER